MDNIDRTVNLPWNNDFSDCFSYKKKQKQKIENRRNTILLGKKFYERLPDIEIFTDA